MNAAERMARQVIANIPQVTENAIAVMVRSATMYNSLTAIVSRGGHYRVQVLNSEDRKYSYCPRTGTKPEWYTEEEFCNILRVHSSRDSEVALQVIGWAAGY